MKCNVYMVCLYNTIPPCAINTYQKLTLDRSFIDASNDPSPNTIDESSF
jgi:hypothetical protein